MADNEVSVTFRTNLPEQFQVPEEAQVQVATSSVALELGQIVKQLVAENDLDDESAGLLKGRKLMFMVQNSIMTGTLQDLMDKLALSSESVLELHYAFALDKPKLAASLPQEEWISRIRPMSQFGSNKATDYIVAFFNGDVKLFAGDSKEMLEVKGVHEEAIVDALYLHEQDGSRKVITVSEQPGPALKMFEVSRNKASMNLVAKASDDMAEAQNGFTCLAGNPIKGELFASASQYYERVEDSTKEKVGAVQLWNTNGEMGNGLAQEGSNKRQRVETKQLAPHQAIQVKGGVGSLAWLDGQSLVAGCVNDHALKVLDAETAQISATVLTDYKAPLAIDATQGNLIVAGCEDAILRLFDVRANTKVRSINKTYDGHSRAITSVACNPQVENVLISGSIDGTVKLWDLRNDEAPLAQLKHKKADENFKVFATAWNGASQILSGGSDSHVSVHRM